MFAQREVIGAFVATDPRGRVVIIDVLPNNAGYELRTEDGHPVLRRRQGEYWIDGTDIRLTSDDPESI